MGSYRTHRIAPAAWRRWPVCAIATVSISWGCAGATPSGGDFDGAYRGVTRDGRSIVLDLEERDGSIHGGGRIGDVAIRLAGTVRRSASTLLVAEDGRGGPVRIEPSSGGLELDTWEGPVLLVREDALRAPPPTGPLSGHYRATSGSAVQADLRIQQHGALLTGTGEVLGRPAALAGRTLANGDALASVVFDDGSRLEVRIERSERGSLRLRSLDRVLALERIGAGS